MSPSDVKHRDALEAVVKRHKDGFLKAAEALLELHDQGLYRLTHRRFEDYCLDRLGIDRKYAYFIMVTARTAQKIRERFPDDPLPDCEGQTRKIGSDPDTAAEVWHGAVEYAGVDGRARPTSEDVEYARLQLLGGKHSRKERAQAVSEDEETISGQVEQEQTQRQRNWRERTIRRTIRKVEMALRACRRTECDEEVIICKDLIARLEARLS